MITTVEYKNKVINLNILRQQVQIYLDKNDYEKALSILEMLSEISPNDTDILYNLATCYRQSKMFCKAIDIYEKLENKPQNLFSKAYCMHLNNQNNDAMHILNKLENICDKNSEIYFKTQNMIALIYLQEKNWIQAESYWKQRWNVLSNKPRKYNIPYWNNDNLLNKTLLICCDQGIGDEVMYASFFNQVIEENSNSQIIIECDNRLVLIFKKSFSKAKVIARNKNYMPVADYMIYSSELIFKYNIIQKEKFLIPNQEIVKNFNQKYNLLAQDKIKIGIAWFSDDPETGYLRNVPFENLLPILSNKDYFFVNLQYGITQDTIHNLNKKYNTDIYYDIEINPIKTLDLFLHQINSLDIVITIANSTAHFAGALGVKTKILLPKIASWRWFDDQKNSTWYKNVKLYKQDDWNNWDNQINKILIDID